MVAATILEQLGGRRFLTMTGAKDLQSHDQALSFRLPGGRGFCREGINYVKITLTPMDEYDVEFGRTRAMKYTIVKLVSGIYADQLREIFTEATGLDVHL